jgi:sulfite reductase (NADPH) flavoprotein alpha-component
MVSAPPAGQQPGTVLLDRADDRVRAAPANRMDWQGKSMSEDAKITVLFATQTGNAMTVGDWIEESAVEAGFDTDLVDAADCAVADLADVDVLLLAISTAGIGEPPFDAQLLHRDLHQDEAPRLEDLRYSVVALGDCEYEHFCQAGKEFDARLEALGATRIYPRRDCDINFEAPAREWIADVLRVLSGDAVPASDFEEPAPPTPRGDAVMLPLQQKMMLSRSGSAKQVYHYVLGATGHALRYSAGDTLAVRPLNSAGRVARLIKLLGFPDDTALNDGTPLATALIPLDISAITRREFRAYIAHCGSETCQRWVAAAGDDEIGDYLRGRDWRDVVTAHPPTPGALAPDQFVESLRRLSPRQYSIASSPMMHPDEIHLTVSTVRYEADGRQYNGICSTYLADLASPGDPVEVAVQSNPGFRLPDDGATAIIMIGPGVGVAPFRAFMQERQALGASGRNWLFFGDQHRACDFLYEDEWQAHLQSGLLTRLDLAFSRDTQEKVYVQHRLREHAEEIYAWLEDGAHIYVCGDARSMAGDVEAELTAIVARMRDCSDDEATAYIKHLRRVSRYQTDVY